MQTTTLCTVGGVLEHDHVLALEAGEAEFGDRLAAVGEQAPL